MLEDVDRAEVGRPDDRASARRKGRGGGPHGGQCRGVGTQEDPPRARACIDEPPIQGQVGVGHPGRAEPLEDARPDRRSVQPLDAREEEGHVPDVVPEPAVDALAEDLGQAADPAGDDRRATGQRLDRDEPERLRPCARHQGRVARREQLVTFGRRDLAEVFDGRTGRLQGRQEDLVVVVALSRDRADLGGDPDPPAGRLGDLHRVDDALLGVDAAHEAQLVGAVVPVGMEGGAGQVETVVDHLPGDVRVSTRLASADRDEPGGRTPEEARRPRLIQSTMECAGDRHGGAPRERQAEPLEMRVDQIEAPGPAEDEIQGLEHVRADVIAEAVRAKGLRHRRDEPAGDVGVAAGERRHIVTAPGQLDGQGMDDPLRAAVRGRRHALDRRRDECDAHRLGAVRGAGGRGQQGLGHRASRAGEHPSPGTPQRYPAPPRSPSAGPRSDVAAA